MRWQSSHSTVDVVMPSLAYPWLGGPICLLIAFNLLVHYYLVVTTNPGFVEDLPQVAGKGFLWATPRNMSKERPLMEGVRWSTELNVTKAELTKCRKCGQQKPEVSNFPLFDISSWRLYVTTERSHHCRICNRCVLKYDHHCPVRVLFYHTSAYCCNWFDLQCTPSSIPNSILIIFWPYEGINQCVGLYNERHFVLFMYAKTVAFGNLWPCYRAYLCISTFCFCVLGYPQFFDALGLTFKVSYAFPNLPFVFNSLLKRDPWPHHVPVLIYIIEFILSGVLCFAVGIMLMFHLWTIGHGETSVESQDNEFYSRMAKNRGEVRQVPCMHGMSYVYLVYSYRPS